MSNILIYWTLPWKNDGSLLGLELSPGCTITNHDSDESYVKDVISIGLILIRIDIII